MALKEGVIVSKWHYISIGTAFVFSCLNLNFNRKNKSHEYNKKKRCIVSFINE